MEKTICNRCNKEYEYNRSKGHKKTICNSCNVTLFRIKRKKQCLLYKGSKCQKCGYDKCDAALEFHHLDPKKKDFGISRQGIPKSWEKVKKELDKCILICSNCHKELHYNNG